MQNDITKNIDFVKTNTLDNICFSFIQQSKIHGFGLFSTKDISQNTILGILDGQIIDWNKYDEIVKNIETNIYSYKNYFFMEWNALNENTLLIRPFRTKYSYINHSYTPNLKIEYNPLRIMTIKDIKENEEFTLDYSKEPLKKDYLNGHGKSYL